MATPSDARAVKSLNKSPGRKRFVYKSFSERLQEVDIDVYRSLDPIKPEPTEGSSFLRDCLVEWRELNTAEDFVSFYELMLPKVQTLPLVIVHKELILSELLARLTMKARLSLEPILRLIVALSRDLLDDFLPFLQRVLDELVCLLNCGADREPEIIEQIFTSCSYILMYLQKYLVQDMVHILKVTIKLRYIEKDYVQEFMAEAVSFLLRNAPSEQLYKGVRKLMFEVVEDPSFTRKFGVTSLLQNTMQRTSLGFHSRAKEVLQLLMDPETFAIGDKVYQGTDTILEVVGTTFERLCKALKPTDLSLLWDCLYVEITSSVTKEYLLHTSRLLSLLISTVQIERGLKISDYQQILELVELLMQTYINSCSLGEAKHSSKIVDKILQLALHVLDGLHSTNDMAAMSAMALRWTPIFKLGNTSMLKFIRELLQRDPFIPYIFRINILSVLNEFINASKDEGLYLTLIFFEKMRSGNFKVFSGIPEKGFLRISDFLLVSISHGIQLINEIQLVDLPSTQFDEAKLALLWGVTSCYSFMLPTQEKRSLLMELAEAVDHLLIIDSDSIAGLPRHAWQGLIGAALTSYHNLNTWEGTGPEEISKFLNLAKRHKSCLQVLLSVADFLDSLPKIQADVNHKIVNLELSTENVMEAMELFAENLCHSNREIRVSTLRILCHYESISCESFGKALPVKKECSIDHNYSNVLNLLHSIEATPLSISNTRKITLLISKIYTGLASERVSEAYVPIVLNGIIGILHNRFSYLWDPSLECLTVLISKHGVLVWDRFVSFVEQYQLKFLTLGEPNIVEPKSCERLSGLVDHFNQFVYSAYDSTPCGSILSLLLQSLQKIPSIVDSRSRQIVPLFLKFLGYNHDDLVNTFCVGSFKSSSCKGKEWKGVLKEWLNLLKVTRNLRSFYCNHFLKEVLQKRLLDEIDAEIQMKVLDCLLTWKDEFLLPYDQHLRNLVISKNLREELVRWSLSKESNLIEDHHRSNLVPFVIRLLMPKVRKLKALGTQKKTGVHSRKAVLAFIAQLNPDELKLFFSLLIRPLLVISEGADDDVASSGRGTQETEASMDVFQPINFFNNFTIENIMSLSWKKKFGFLHVVEDVLGVFDESRVRPFLGLLMGCVVRVLESCTVSINMVTCSEFVPIDEGLSVEPTVYENDDSSRCHVMSITARKQNKNLRSFCLKITSMVLNKYDDHDFGFEFWDLFFKSVQPLIQNFKQEVSSSENPSSLFLCFVSMSRSPNLVSLLCREENLVPDIFSILSAPAASEAIISCVLKFAGNLLVLNTEMGDESDDDGAKRIILSNLEPLTYNMHFYFLKNATKRKSANWSGETELKIFKLLSKYMKEALLARKFVEMLLPLVSARTQNSDASVEILHVIGDIIPVLGDDVTVKILNAVYPLVISAKLDLRLAICTILNRLAQTDPVLQEVASLFHELNATSTVEIGELDYDSILTAYGKIRVEFFYNIQPDHALIVLSHFVFDMSSDELILRQSAFRSVCAFVEFSSGILRRDSINHLECSEVTIVCSEDGWSAASILQIINKFLLKHMGEAMKNETSVHKEWIELLQTMVLKLPEVPTLNSLQALCSKDAEVDFFNNIIHLQKHRRGRALSRFKSVVTAGNLSKAITYEVFVPLFWNMLFETRDGKGEHVRSACLEALAAISGCMDWDSYYMLLKRCLKEMKLKPDKQKLLQRLLCSILDHFHFSTDCSNQEAECLVEDVSSRGNSISSLTVFHKCDNSVNFVRIQNCLLKTVLPKIQKILDSDSEMVNVSINVAALKLLKLLPGDMIESQLPTIIHRISNFLKNRLESIRDQARFALAACLKELGLEYLQFFISILRGILKRGYELHVLGYTVNFILSSILHSSGWKLDYCLGDLLSVAENDIFGDVAKEKEVEKIASKMKETKKKKSFETLRLIAQNITFKSNALKLLSPVTAHTKKHLTPELKKNLQEALRNIAAGIESNPSVDLTDLFVYLYDRIQDGVMKENHLVENSSTMTNKESKSDASRRIKSLGGVAGTELHCSHLVTVFALDLLCKRIKNMKFDKNNPQVLSMLDPFIELLANCLSSKYEDVLTLALKTLKQLIRLPLPALENQANKIKAAVLDTAQSSTNMCSSLSLSCLELLKELLRSTKITLSTDQLHMLIQFPLFVDLERNPSPIAFSLLKAIVSRKLVVHEIYDLVTRVAELMVTSQVENMRKKCREILLRFLLDYQISRKRLQQHLNFVLENLRYEHLSGRESALEMLHAVIKKFPKSIVEDQSWAFFLHLVVSLANDQDNKIRSMTGEAIKLLFGRMNQHLLQSVFEKSLYWYLDKNQQLWSAAAQVLGLLVEVKNTECQVYVSSVLPVTRKILQSAIDAVKGRQDDMSSEATVPFWKEAYYSLVMLEKMLNQFSELCFQRDIEDIWEVIGQFLLHPHMWLRNISNRLVAFYFVAVSKASSEKLESSFTFFLLRPSRLFALAVSICFQLTAQLTDDAASTFISENLVFAVCNLHYFVEKMECTEAHTFWSNLDSHDHGCFLRAFQLLDSRKGSGVFSSLLSAACINNDQELSEDLQYCIVSSLVKKMGKIALQMEAIQMKVVFSSFKEISLKIGEGGVQRYAIEMLHPLYKVCEGFSGKVITDDVKLLAQEVCQEIRNKLGTEKFVLAYNKIRKSLKLKREKRKQGEKLLAVTNPMRNAKRKLRIAEKHRAHKKRKIMTMKMGRLMR